MRKTFCESCEQLWREWKAGVGERPNGECTLCGLISFWKRQNLTAIQDAEREREFAVDH